MENFWNRVVVRRSEALTGWVLALAALAVYLATLCPTLNFIDSGELATDVFTFGIAHPTGYPLFILCGYLYSHIPAGLRVITQINLLAALLCSVAVFVFYRFLLVLLGSRIRSAAKRDHAFQVVVPAAAGTLLLAFSETFWSQALSVEVYPLHLVFLSLLLLLFAKAMLDPGEGSGGRRIWVAFAFVLGLSFTNHGTTILLAPAFLTAYFARSGLFSKTSWRHIAGLVPPFAAGLSVLLVLPVRASGRPMMNWGDPTDLHRFWYHVSGGVYHVWMFSSWESAGKQLQYFISSLPPEFAYWPLALAVAGLWTLAARDRRTLVVTLLLFVGCVAYAVNYDIHDIDSYFLLAYMTVAVWCAVGVRSILAGAGGMRLVVAAALLGGTAGEIAYHYTDVDESRMTMVEDYSRNMLASVGPGAILITYQWDYFVSAAYYLQIVEHVREDVTVIDKELLRRTWYLQQADLRYPWLFASSRRELGAYRAELVKFEHELPYDPGAIEARYNAFIHSIISTHIGSRPVYVTTEIEPQYTAGYQRIPSGLAFRLSADSLLPPVPEPSFDVRTPGKSDKYIEGITGMYAQCYVNHGLYAHFLHNDAEALRMSDKALALQPGYRDALLLRDRIAPR